MLALAYALLVVPPEPANALQLEDPSIQIGFISYEIMHGIKYMPHLAGIRFSVIECLYLSPIYTKNNTSDKAMMTIPAMREYVTTVSSGSYR